MLRDREVADAIGQLCDGLDIPADYRSAVVTALAGTVVTDRGSRLYYADLETLLLPTVDTEEGIWSVAEDGIVRGANNRLLVDLSDDQAAVEHALFPLAALGDKARMSWWTETMQRAGNQERYRWARFVRRVLDPLQRALSHVE